MDRGYNEGMSADKEKKMNQTEQAAQKGDAEAYEHAQAQARAYAQAQAQPYTQAYAQMQAQTYARVQAQPYTQAQTHEGHVGDLMRYLPQHLHNLFWFTAFFIPIIYFSALTIGELADGGFVILPILLLIFAFLVALVVGWRIIRELILMPSKKTNMKPKNNSILV